MGDFLIRQFYAGTDWGTFGVINIPKDTTWKAKNGK